MSEVCVCIVAVVVRHANDSSSWAVSYCHLWHVWPYHILIHYLISSTVGGEKNLSNIIYVQQF